MSVLPDSGLDPHVGSSETVPKTTALLPEECECHPISLPPAQALPIRPEQGWPAGYSWQVDSVVKIQAFFRARKVRDDYRILGEFLN